MSMHYLEQTRAEKEEMKENFFMRLLFKAYFPVDNFNHLHQTANQLLLKLFSTEAFLLKLNPYLYVDQSVANDSLEYRIAKLNENLNTGKYNNSSLIDSIQHTLLYSDRKGLENVPYFLK
jgi:DNA recombination-dependent growth factor C